MVLFTLLQLVVVIDNRLNESDCGYLCTEFSFFSLFHLSFPSSILYTLLVQLYRQRSTKWFLDFSQVNTTLAFSVYFVWSWGFGAASVFTNNSWLHFGWHLFILLQFRFGWVAWRDKKAATQKKHNTNDEQCYCIQRCKYTCIG